LSECVHVYRKKEFDLTSKQDAKVFFQDNQEKICEFNFKGFNGWCRVMSVYDGDTMTLAIPFEGKVYKHSVRLEGIDTPEMRGNDKHMAVMARDRLIQLITNIKHASNDLFTRELYLVWFECSGFDKYKRLLGNVFMDPNQCSVTDILITEGHGKSYDGGKKE
jgi:endonuclease YncB( thermonuclease family)